MNKRRVFISLVVLVAAALVSVAFLVLLKPKAADENEEYTTDVAVHIGKITRSTLHRYVMAYGVVKPEPAGGGKQPAGAQVASPVAGLIAMVNCSEGQRVEKGTILFRLDSRVAEIAYQKAKKFLEFAEQNYERQKKLVDVEGTSKKNYQEAEQQFNAARNDLEAAETDLALLNIQAPLAGAVVKINTKTGEAVELNTVLAEIVDLDRLVAAADVPSNEAALLKNGQSVELGNGLMGHMIFVGQQIDPRTDTVLVRVSIPSKAGLRPGQFLSLRIVCEERRDCLVVPGESLVSSAEEGSWIMLVQGDKALRKPVKAGLHENGLVEVEGEGLKEGMVIVTDDAYSLPKETKIRIIER